MHLPLVVMYGFGVCLIFFSVSNSFVAFAKGSQCPAKQRGVVGNSLSLYSTKESNKWVTTVLSRYETEGSQESPNLDVSQAVIRCAEKEILQVKMVLRELEHSNTTGADKEPVMVLMNKKIENECKGINNLKIVTRSEWGAGSERSPSDILRTTDCVVVDGSSYIITGTDYSAKMKEDQEYQIKKFGSFFDNFHISDDGVVYEALGWDKIYFVRSGGLKCLRIAFLKSTRDGSPSTAATNTFNDLLNTAICLGKLSPYYRIIPYHFIHNHHSLGPDSFERKQLLKWDKCEQDTDLTKADYDYGSFPIIFREDWGGKEAINTVYNRTSKIKFIMVGNYDVRCFTTKNCIQTLKRQQQVFNDIKEDFRSNYLIADDGLAYEVFHWNQTWHEYWLNKEVMLIEFLGRFHSYLPSERAMKSFHRLLRLGELWGYLAPDYKIVSYRQKDDELQYIGDMLDEHVRKMERFTSEFP